jgi:hypothetical protein
MSTFRVWFAESQLNSEPGCWSCWVLAQLHKWRSNEPLESTSSGQLDGVSLSATTSLQLSELADEPGSTASSDDGGEVGLADKHLGCDRTHSSLWGYLARTQYLSRELRGGDGVQEAEVPSETEREEFFDALEMDDFLRLNRSCRNMEESADRPHSSAENMAIGCVRTRAQCPLHQYSHALSFLRREKLTAVQSR